MQPTTPPPVTAEDRTWGMIAHLGGVAGLLGAGTLGWLVPLVVWLIKKDQSPFVAFHALEELLFQLAWIPITIVAAIVLFMTCVGVVFLPAVIAIPFIWSIIAAVKANNGEWYVYPVVGPFALSNVGISQ